ncbi:hypothetical protein BGZ61DRAFT_463736 [Ilyonectria robusta]|uniref:uncharacterized protein n=1 Tax=Ilyonectria robusta TaxID=1079257 RepID=UPI001E8D9B07|nr:uncharacterized protein BGZ61DRAFT_463736 [Ilyonectria robusta]KAH8661825.1 hypothetical protein BGZ61DRAFT_463736 [Ilyonectria robusta]
MTAVQPFMKEHEAACRAALNPFCENCGLLAMNLAKPHVLASRGGGSFRWHLGQSRVWERGM